MTFTKEQLIASAHGRIDFANMMLSDNPEPLKERTWAIELRLAEIALAALTAEPAYFINRVKHSDAYGYDVELRAYCYELDAMKSKEDFGGEIVAVFTAPPAPVVPDGVERKDFEAWARSAGFNEDWYFFTNTHPNHYDDDHINDMWASWNACRAAMLQGADPVQATTLRDGWVAVPVDMAPEQMRAVQLNSELGAYAAANLSGAYSLFREFWDVAIAAAPQQEVFIAPIEETSVEEFKRQYPSEQNPES